eukprot:jgi/Mesen1/5573/ME000281S04632
MAIHTSPDVFLEDSEEQDLRRGVEQQGGKLVPRGLFDGPILSAAEDVRTSPLQRKQHGSELCYTVGIFDKPYAVCIGDLYDIGPVLGFGHYGCVRSCMHRGLGEKFALKIIPKSLLTTLASVEMVRQEVAIMQAVRGHPMVTALRDALEDSKFVYLVLELCQGGDLFDRVKDLGYYCEADAAAVCASLADVLRHCRRRGVMHGDIKPENILLCSRHSRTDIRVADFGAGAFVQPGKKLTVQAGSLSYVAPEVIAGRYGWEADIWSTGVVLYVLLCGHPPFPGQDQAHVLAAIQSGHLDFSWGPWLRISEDAKDLVRHMLTLNPELRITPQEILEEAVLSVGPGSAAR